MKKKSFLNDLPVIIKLLIFILLLNGIVHIFQFVKGFSEEDTPKESKNTRSDLVNYPVPDPIFNGKWNIKRDALEEDLVEKNIFFLNENYGNDDTLFVTLDHVNAPSDIIAKSTNLKFYKKIIDFLFNDNKHTSEIDFYTYYTPVKLGEKTLDSVTYYIDSDNPIDDFYTARKTLISKYGKPDEEIYDDGYRNPLKLFTEKKATEKRHSIYSNHDRLYCSWKFSDSIIYLRLEISRESQLDAPLTFNYSTYEEDTIK